MESLLTLNELVAAVKGINISSKNTCCFTNVATDSRNVSENTMFIPLVGEFQDGHKYIPQAIEKGASVILINEKNFCENKIEYEKLCQENSSLVMICVKNTMTGLQDAAEAYVAKFPSLLKICITGSCGKTTTKELMVAVFKAKYGEKVVYTQGNFNSETGLPLSVFNIRSNHTVGIFEMGMNRENEIGEISKVLKAKYGLITNIGTAHIGILGSRENIAKEKRKAFDYIPADGAAFVPAEDDFADYCTEKVAGKVVKFGKTVSESESGVKFICDNGLKGLSFTVDGTLVNMPLSGIHNFINVSGVIACAKECGIETEYIKKGIESLESLNGRMEVSESVLANGKNVTLIKDCYNANPDSMEKVIDFCDSLTDCGKKIFVLGDMKELGEKAVSAHEQIGRKLLDSKASYVFLVGSDMKNAFEVITRSTKFTEKNSSFFKLVWKDSNSSKEFEEIAEELLSVTDENDVIVFKGSHSMSLDKIIPLIEKKAGE